MSVDVMKFPDLYPLARTFAEVGPLLVWTDRGFGNVTASRLWKLPIRVDSV
jgi:hypothetical protein